MTKADLHSVGSFPISLQWLNNSVKIGTEELFETLMTRDGFSERPGSLVEFKLFISFSRISSVVWTKLNLFVFKFIRPLFLSNEKVLAIYKSLSLAECYGSRRETCKNILKRFPILWGSIYSTDSLTNTFEREFSLFHDFIFIIF